MLTDKLDNCRICGRLFLKEHTDYCLDCYEEIEQQFKCVSDFLKSEANRYATIEMVSEATGVALKRIADFIRDGRIFAEDFPNLGYPCSHCGKLIKRQVLCNDCFENLSSDINKTIKREKLMDEMDNKKQRPVNDPQYWRLKQDK